MREEDLYHNNIYSIWSDVMGELRTGIKLKKVSFSKTPSEFGLTPYEMLMSDIRKQSVKLNPTKIPPKVKTDAKDIILEFIRSRPPLRKASNRKLAPRVKQTTPMEDLMEVFLFFYYFINPAEATGNRQAELVLIRKPLFLL